MIYQINPTQSIQAAADKANPGDTILLAAGVYHQATILERSGTSALPITIAPDPAFPGVVEINGTGVVNDKYGNCFGQLIRPSQYGTRAGGQWWKLVKLTLNHAANVNVGQGGAALLTNSNWTLDHVCVQNSASTGIGWAGDNVVGTWTVAQFNGQEGWAGGATKNLRLTNCQTRYNNLAFKFDAGNDAGGGKFSATDGTVIDTCSAYQNGGPGVWFDGSNLNFTVKNSSIYGNFGPSGSAWQGAGIVSEINQGPGLIQNNLVYGNSGSCVGVWESQNISVLNNIMQVVEWGLNLRDIPTRDPYYLKNITVMFNQFSYAPIPAGQAWYQQAAVAADQAGVGTSPDGVTRDTSWSNSSGATKGIVIDCNAYEGAGLVYFFWKNGTVYTAYTDLPSVRTTLGFETGVSQPPLVFPAIPTIPKPPA